MNRGSTKPPERECKEKSRHPWRFPYSNRRMSVDGAVHSFGAPARTRSHYFAILALLRDRGPAGLLASELYDNPTLYGRSPRNRISELRKDGFKITGKARGSSDWFYCLEAEPSDSPAKPLTQDGQRTLPLAYDMRETISRVERDDFYEGRGSADWYTRTTGRQRA